MSFQLINIGSAPNDGTGDKGRVAFDKINQNYAVTQTALDGLQTSLNGKAALSSPAFVGTPTAPTATAGTNSTQVATTAFVTGTLGSYATTASVTATLGSYLTISSASATYAAKASPVFTGTPQAPTAGAADNSTQLATTAFVQGLMAAGAAVPLGTTIGSDYYEFTANTNFTTNIPSDDTIPQITEGDQMFSVTRAASSATNAIEIDFDSWWGLSAAAKISAALFIDGASNAVRASTTVAAGAGNPLRLVYRYVPGNTSSHTFVIRCGPDAAVTARPNGTNTARFFGGVAATTLRVREIKA